MHMKLALVLLLYVYHGYTHRLVSQCLNDTCRMSSYRLRMWNELATLFLFGIVFLVVLKTNNQLDVVRWRVVVIDRRISLCHSTVQEIPSKTRTTESISDRH